MTLSEDPIETPEKHWWYCGKCGDEYYADTKEIADTYRNQRRWRCHSCVMGWF